MAKSPVERNAAYRTRLRTQLNTRTLALQAIVAWLEGVKGERARGAREIALDALGEK